MDDTDKLKSRKYYNPRKQIVWAGCVINSYSSIIVLILNIHTPCLVCKCNNLYYLPSTSPAHFVLSKIFSSSARCLSSVANLLDWGAWCQSWPCSLLSVICVSQDWPLERMTGDPKLALLSSLCYMCITRLATGENDW